MHTRTHTQHTHTPGIFRSSEEVEESGLIGDGPGLEDEGQPEPILLLPQLGGMVQKHPAVQEPDVPLQHAQGEGTGLQHLPHTLL